MGKLKILSWKDVVFILGSFGFYIVSQKGSHVKLVRLHFDGERQILTIPLHDELDKGTLRAIMRQASRYIPEDSFEDFFYSD